MYQSPLKKGCKGRATPAAATTKVDVLIAVPLLLQIYLRGCTAAVILAMLIAGSPAVDGSRPPSWPSGLADLLRYIAGNLKRGISTYINIKRARQDQQ